MRDLSFGTEYQSIFQIDNVRTPAYIHAVRKQTLTTDTYDD